MILGCMIILFFIGIVGAGLLLCGISGLLAWQYIGLIFLAALIIVLLALRKRSKR